MWRRKQDAEMMDMAKQVQNLQIELDSLAQYERQQVKTISAVKATNEFAMSYVAEKEEVSN